MGSPESEEGRDDLETQHKVTLTRGFWLMETELTQKQWKAITGDNPSHFKGANLPVETISWDDCDALVNELNEEVKAAPEGWRFSLPTEAQWEYACRAGTTTAYFWGDSLNGHRANCDGNYPCGTTAKGPFLKKTSPARSYAPNAWGLYDMSGNVWEWCLDYFKEYPKGDVVDPASLEPEDDEDLRDEDLLEAKRLLESLSLAYEARDEDFMKLGLNHIDVTLVSKLSKVMGPFRVLRGGCWFQAALHCRSAARCPGVPDENNPDATSFLGARLALVSGADDSETASAAFERVSPESVGREVSGFEVSGFDGDELAGDRATLTVNGVEFAFRYCPAGEFMMGSPESEEGRGDDETQHKVTLTRGFWLMETELTQKQWKAIMGANPSYFKGDDLPIETISWNDCQELIEKLNARSSKPSGWKFELPTEAQWEYACRAGTETPFSWGSSLNGDKANCNGNYPYGTRTKGPFLKKTNPARSYAPNAWGFYDMHGNVWEWCQDWYGDYSEGEATDPVGPEAGSLRVLRGGGWGSLAVNCRSANRDWYDAGGRFSLLGARLALVSTSN